MDVSVAQIVEFAGVGKGTFFRHFTSKEDLVATIYADRLTELADAGDRIMDAADPGAALLGFFMDCTKMQLRDRSFCQAAVCIAVDHPAVAAALERLLDIVDRLTVRAQKQGVVRADIIGQDLFLLLTATSQAVAPLSDADPELWRRYVSLIFDGVRAEGAHPLPQPPPAMWY